MFLDAISNRSSQLLQNSIPEFRKLSHRPLIDRVCGWNMHGYRITYVRWVKPWLVCKICLQVEPVTHIILRIVHNQHAWHWLVEPKPEIGALDRKSNSSLIEEQLQIVRGLQLNQNVPVLDLAVRVIREQHQIHAVIMLNSLHGKPAQEC